MIGYMICESPVICEDTKIVSEHNNRLIAEGTLQDVGVENRNGRIYTGEELFPELKCARTMELLKSGNMKGENGHPMAKDLNRQQTIDPNNTVVKFLELWHDGNKIKGRYKGCNNQLGEDFNNDLLDDEKPSFSLRALGGIEMRGGRAYVKGVKLITYDRVIYPSHKVAYTEKIVSESASIAEIQQELKNLSEASINAARKANTKLIVNEDYKGLFSPIMTKEILEYAKHESANVGAIIKSFDTEFKDFKLINDNGIPRMQLVNEAGEVIVVALERQISNEIIDYCTKQYF